MSWLIHDPGQYLCQSDIKTVFQRLYFHASTTACQAISIMGIYIIINMWLLSVSCLYGNTVSF